MCILEFPCCSHWPRPARTIFLLVQIGGRLVQKLWVTETRIARDYLTLLCKFLIIGDMGNSIEYEVSAESHCKQRSLDKLTRNNWMLSARARRGENSSMEVVRLVELDKLDMSTRRLGIPEFRGCWLPPLSHEHKHILMCLCSRLFSTPNLFPQAHTFPFDTVSIICRGALPVVANACATCVYVCARLRFTSYLFSCVTCRPTVDHQTCS